jgi:hypothetical protein
MPIVDKTTELSEEALESVKVKTGQGAMCSPTSEPSLTPSTSAFKLDVNELRQPERKSIRHDRFLGKRSSDRGGERHPS